jgi:hypothetical protein
MRDDLLASIKEVSTMAELPMATVVEALLSARLGIPHAHESAAARAVARWKAGVK